MPKRILQGVVVSNASEKTAVVRIERRVAHPMYGKVVRLSKKYHAHDEDNACQVGEVVRIEECSPISRKKRWRVIGSEA
ncbi:MAG: 30S ribosomal protein S17 [Alphaproteobacteria bacterium]|nr:MAG: 30S ribosomal protein S17 [Alphaproteobacteria bacterium]